MLFHKNNSLRGNVSAVYEDSSFHSSLYLVSLVAFSYFLLTEKWQRALVLHLSSSTFSDSLPVYRLTARWTWQCRFNPDSCFLWQGKCIVMQTTTLQTRISSSRKQGTRMDAVISGFILACIKRHVQSTRSNLEGENALGSFSKSVAISNHWHLSAECVLEKSEHICWESLFCYIQQHKKGWKITAGIPHLQWGKKWLQNKF